jgi:hypothetical protein
MKIIKNILLNIYYIFFLFLRWIVICIEGIFGKLPGMMKRFWYITGNTFRYMFLCVLTIIFKKSWSESTLSITIEDFNCRVLGVWV